MYWYWTRPRKIAASLLAVALVMGALSYFFGSSLLLRLGITSDVPSANSTVIYMDGWSMKNVGRQPVYLADSQYGRTQTRLRFTAVNAHEVADLQSHAPGLLADVASRMISASSSVTCSSAGCFAGSRALNPDWFRDASSIPGLGAEYRGYHIASTLYAAEVPGPVRENVWLRFGGQQLSLVEPPAGTGVPGDPRTNTAGNGFYAHRWLVASAFGQLFSPRASWRAGAGGSLEVGAVLGSPSATKGGDVAVVRGGYVFTGGLGAASPQVAGLSSAQLTFMSSPTTGCGPGVLCVPGTTSGLRAAMRTSVSKWCLSGSEVVAVTGRGRWSYNFSVPTAQFGAWATNPDAMAGSAGGDPWTWRGAVPLSQGALSWDQYLVYMTSSDPAVLIGVGGTSGIASAFVDGTHVSANTSRASSAASLAGTVVNNYFGPGYSAC